MAPTRVLVVANRTAATQPLLDAVRERAARGACSFTLVVPAPVQGLDRMTTPDDTHINEAKDVIERAIPLLEQASGGPVEGIIGEPDPLTAIHDAVNVQGFDEIIISTLPTRVSRWLRLDLPHKAAGLGLPVTTVTATSDEEAAA
jgi:hypothetical protein